MVKLYHDTSFGLSARQDLVCRGIILAILRDFVLISTQTTDRPPTWVARALSNLLKKIAEKSQQFAETSQQIADTPTATFPPTFKLRNAPLKPTTDHNR